MALSIIHDLANDINGSSFYSIVCDECTDSSNCEQLVICICWVNHKDLEVHEDVIGLYKVDNISAATIVDAIKDTLLHLNLPLTKCRGQCYDGASNMKIELWVSRHSLELFRGYRRQPLYCFHFDFWYVTLVR